MYRMRLSVLAAWVSVFVAACGGPPAAPASSTRVPASPERRVPPPVAIPIAAPVVAIVDVPGIAGKSRREVAARLGEPTACETVKQGTACSFIPGATTVVFIAGRADWITVEALDGAPYSEHVLPLLGLDRAAATFSSAHSLRWTSCPGLLEVNVFPAGEGVEYAYIKTATP